MSANQIKLQNPMMNRKQIWTKEFSLMKVPSVDENTWALRVKNQNYWMKMNDLLKIRLNWALWLSLCPVLNYKIHFMCVQYTVLRVHFGKKMHLDSMVFFFRSIWKYFFVTFLISNRVFVAQISKFATHTFIEQFNQLFAAIQFYSNWFFFYSNWIIEQTGSMECDYFRNKLQNLFRNWNEFIWKNFFLAELQTKWKLKFFRDEWFYTKMN